MTPLSDNAKNVMVLVVLGHQPGVYTVNNEYFCGRINYYCSCYNFLNPQNENSCYSKVTF